MAEDFEWDQAKATANLRVYGIAPYGRYDMSKTVISVRIRPDGTVVRVGSDGGEQAFPKRRAKLLTEAEVLAAADADPDAHLMSPRALQNASMLPRVRTLRRALALTQEEFAVRYQIPLGTLRDWEQGRTAPDQPARAYLKVIARDPEGVCRALNDRLV